MRIQWFKSGARKWIRFLRDNHFRPHEVAKTRTCLCADQSDRALFILTPLLLVCLTSVAGVSQTKPPGQRVENAKLKVRTFCSKVNPGIAVAEISWSDGGSASARSAIDSSAQIVVTTVKDGFSTGAAVKVWPPQGKERFGVGLGTSDHRLDPLRALEASTEPSTNTKSTARAPADEQKEAGGNSIKIRNLEPGINYFWRLQRGGGGTTPENDTVMTTAPVCPADFKK
jgi:hypothetical protein